MPVFLLHKLTIGFAVIRVISGVFLHETFTVASQDNDAMIRTEKMAAKKHAEKIDFLFKRADTSGDGFLDEKEFQSLLSKKDITVWLSSMGLTIQDGQEAFRLLQGEAG